MEDNELLTTQISIDLKKYRIRVHKESLHLIGDPAYIQFLVSVDKSMLAIRGVDSDSSGLAAIRVNLPNLRPDFSYEIYSTSLVDKLAKAFGCFEPNCTYRLTGKVLVEERAVVFSVSTLQKVDVERPTYE